MTDSSAPAEPGLEKIDLKGFKPAELQDQPQPMMIWAKIDDLVIDRRYQRAITAKGKSAIQRIAHNFDWRKYQPILVAPAQGGKFAVVDGQHRAHAAALCGIEQIPAMTVPMTPKEQAAGFAAINRDRISIDNLSIYRAELHAGAEWAVTLKATVEAAGCTVATSMPSSIKKKPRVIYAVSLIRKMIETGEGEAVTAGLQAITQSDGCEELENYSGPVISVWLRALATNQRFLSLDLASAFDEIDIVNILDQSKIKARQTGQSGRHLAIQSVIDHLKDNKDRQDAQAA